MKQAPTFETQPDLFRPIIGQVVPKLRAMAAVFVTEQPMARKADPETSQRAGALHPVRRGTDRGRVLLAHAQYPTGMTDFELADVLGLQQTSAGKRRLELQRAIPPYVKATYIVRSAPSGSPATVYIITEAGKEMARILEETR